MTIRAVHHINCATMCPVAGFLMGGGDFWRGRMIAHCLVIETERDGLVLVDSGLGMRDVEGKTGLSAPFRRIVGPALDPREPAVAQVQALGYSAEDAHIVVTTSTSITRAALRFSAREDPYPRARAAAAMRARPSRARGRIKARMGRTAQVESGTRTATRGFARDHAAGGKTPVSACADARHTRGHSHDRAGERPPCTRAMHTPSSRARRRCRPACARSRRVIQTIRPRRRAAALRQLRTSYHDLDLFCAHDKPGTPRSEVCEPHHRRRKLLLLSVLGGDGPTLACYMSRRARR